MTAETEQPHAKGRYLKHELPAAMGLTDELIAELIYGDLFPHSKCDPVYGPSWDRSEVDEFAHFFQEEFF